MGLRRLLEDDPGLAVCGEAVDADAAVAAAARLHPDVVVMDVRLAGGSSGIDATRRIRSERDAPRVLIFTAYGDDDVLFAAILAGAAGFVLKSVPASELARAIRLVAEGASLLDTTVTAQVLERLRQGREVPRDPRLARLTPRELDVLALVADGASNKEIADAIHLSEKTVKNHLTRVFAKLELSRRAEAVAYYSRHRAGL